MAEEKQLTGAEDVIWDLSDIYRNYDDPGLQQDMKNTLKQAEAFAEKHRGKIAQLGAPELAAALADLEKILDTLTNLSSYAYIYWTTDTQNSALSKLVGQIQEHTSRVYQTLLFFELEWRAVDAEQAEKIIHDPAVKAYCHYLEVERLQQPYTLSEPEEKILSEMSLTGVNGWNRYFTEVLGKLTYPFEDREVAQAEITDKLRNPDREIRRKAADSLTQVMKENNHTATFVFNMILSDKFSRDPLRGYKHWLSARNLHNQVDDDSVDILINAVTGRYDLVNRYYRLLKKRLGYDALYDYDRYAPIEEVQTHVPWDEGCNIVLDAFGQFDKRIADIAGEFIEKNWIHAAVKPGKRGGAYCAPFAPSVHPYVFVNYQGNYDSVMTLAHELGHGIHGYLSRGQGVFQADTPLTTAEMASTFGEMLVFDYLVEREKNSEVRLSMRMNKIADTFATVHRQISLNRFEDGIHTARREQGELSHEQFVEIWMKSQQDMFGDSLTLRDDYSVWWQYVTHFTSVPGYVYAYAFGELLVWALYARYQSGLENFADKYVAVLSAGGSDWPANILVSMNIDLQNPDFWNEGLNLLDDFVTRTEKDEAALA